MARLILLNKPFGAICQFRASGARATLKDFVPVPRVYPAGRLDADSEGLVILTDDGAIQARIADPRHKLEKGYWVQVEGTPREEALRALRTGVELQDGGTLPAKAHVIREPAGIPDGEPPIQEANKIPPARLALRCGAGRECT